MRKRWVVAFVLVLALLGAACGGDGGNDGDSSAGDIDPNGVLRIGLNLEQNSIGNLDVTKTATPSNFDLIRYAYDTLLRATPDGFEPGLAKSVEVVDPSTVEIELHEGVVFADGTPFDAEAVKAGILRTVQSKGPSIKAEFLAVAGIDVEDETHLTVHLSEPVAGAWTFLLASGEGMIVSPKAVAEGVDLTQRTAGAGPFMFDRYEPGTLLRFVKNPDYFQADEIKLAAIEFVNTADPNAQTNALLAGDIDVVVNLAYAQRAALAPAGVHVEPIEATSTASTQPWTKTSLCMSRPPFNDKRVREALSLAIDRDAINDVVFGGDAMEMSGGLFPEGSPFHDESLGKYTESGPDRARALLSDAGYGPSNPLTFDAFFIQGDPQKVMEVMQANFKEVGVTMNIAPTLDLFNEFLREARRPAGTFNNQDKGMARITAGYRTGSAFNVCGYSNPELEDLLEKLAASDQITPSDEAKEYWRQIQEIVVGDYLSWSGVFVPLAYAHADRVDGINAWPNAATYTPFADVRYAYVKR